VISLHMNLTDETREFINAERIATMKDGCILINTARGGLVNEADVAAACKSGKFYGFVLHCAHTFSLPATDSAFTT
jgi:phosphoglycerate dehydrogenase-like enzyme